MAVSGRHVPAGHHRGDDGDAHGGAGGERAADGGAVRRGAGPRAVRQRPRSRTARARFRHPGQGTLAASGASRRTTSRGRHEQSAVIVVTPIEPARGPADDLVPVTGHPPFQPGVTRVLLRGRPDAGPVRAPVSADADQVEGLHALAGLRSGVVLEQHQGGPVSASQAGPDPPGRFSDGGEAASLSDDSQVTRRSSRSGSGTQVPGPFPRQAPRRVLPERVINEQLAQRRKVSRGGGRQSFHR
jgi:hypothetical protein